LFLKKGVWEAGAFFILFSWSSRDCGIADGIRNAPVARKATDLDFPLSTMKKE